MPVKYRAEWRKNRDGEYEMVVEMPNRTKKSLERFIGEEMTVEMKWHKAKRKSLEAGIVRHVADELIYLERR